MSWDSCGTIGGLLCEDGQLWELTDTTAGQHIYTHITHCPDCNPSGLDVETWHDTQAADTTDTWLCDTCQGTGMVGTAGTVVCPDCHGDGEVAA